MTPNFALSLSFEGIALLRRMGARWARIEEVPLDHPDLDSAVSALRDRAESLDPAGAQVALVIPNEQIRYLDQPDLGGDAATREVAIRAALDGATPYAVRELKFDHVVSGGRLMVAAVAHITLEEARVFAIDHGFQPVCFLAQAPEGTFDGAVFFGKAKGWTRAVARPARPIEVVAADKAALTPLPPPAAKAETDAAPAPVPSPAARPAPEAPAPAPAAPSARAATPPPAPATRPEPKAAPAPLPGAERGSAPPVTPRPAPPVTAGRAPAATRPAPQVTRPAQVPPVPPKPLAQPQQGPVADLPPEPAVTFATRRASRDIAPSPPDMPPPVATAQLRPRFTPVPQPDTAEPMDTKAAPGQPDLPASPAPAAPVVARKPLPAPTADPEAAAPAAEPAAEPKRGFFAKSAASALLEQAAAAVDATERAQNLTSEPSRPRKLALPKRKAAPPKAPGRPFGKPAAPHGPPPVAQGDAAAGQPPVAAARRTQPRDKAPAGQQNPLARLAALRSAGATALPGGLATAGGAAMAGAATAGGKLFNTSTEREQMTVFGARARGPVGGKPRFLGLILTALLLLFLAGVAAWASVFLEDGLARLFRGNDRTETAVAALPDPVDAPAPAPIADGTILESAAPVAPAPASVPDSTDGPGVQMAAFDTSAEDPVAPLAVPVVPRALTTEEAAASYAATGVWQRAPVSPLTPPEDNVDDIYVASIDPVIQMFDAVALPDVRQLEREPGLADPGLPPPAGLTFDFDARDLVRATPEGALTPDGLRIFTGRPPAVPPLRNSSDESRAPTADGAPGATVARLDSIPRIRPAARPSDVIEQRERVQLGGVSRAELARIRPQMRPQTEQEQAQIDAPEATELAVNRSLIPVGRPRNMAAIVDQAEVTPDPVPVQTAAVAPRTVEPSLPSSASVARSATLENAINLNKINLIGVYGTADNRRALVRLASGKYQKVKIGDSLDGGRVSAIGDDELRYQKSGRDLVLKMPRS